MLQQLRSTRRVVVIPQSLTLHVPDVIEEWAARVCWNGNVRTAPMKLQNTGAVENTMIRPERRAEVLVVQVVVGSRR